MEARSALIQLTPPAVNNAEVVVEASEFQYELSLSDKHDGSYTVMYRSALLTASFRYLLAVRLTCPNDGG